MSKLTYDYAQISAAVEAMIDYVNKLQANLDDLEGILGQLEGTWEAEAQVTYNQAQRAWNEATAQIAQVTNKVQSAVDNAAQDMNTTDQSNAALF